MSCPTYRLRAATGLGGCGVCAGSREEAFVPPEGCSGHLLDLPGRRAITPAKRKHRRTGFPRRRVEFPPSGVRREGMAVFLCGKCGHVREVSSEYIGRAVECPQCKESGSIYDTVNLLNRLIGEYRAKTKELRELRARFAPAEPVGAGGRRAQVPLAEFDLHDTDALADPRQFKPILAWFERRQIQVEVNHRAMDTTGFFDEVAVRLGDRYETLKPVVNQIRYAQRRGIQCRQAHVVEERRRRACRRRKLLPRPPSVLVHREVLLPEGRPACLAHPSDRARDREVSSTASGSSGTCS